MFLHPHEVEELTDRKRLKDQRAWLELHNYPFEESAAGRPKVMRAEVEARLLTKPRQASPQPKRPKLHLVN